MAGENPEDVTRDERGELVKRSDEFLSKTKWERFQVLIMGPVMNVLLAFVLTAVVLYQGAEVGAYEDQPVVVGVVEPASPAARAGIRTGDRIVAVGDHSVDTWDQFLNTITSRPNREVQIHVMRDGRELTMNVTPATQTGENRFQVVDIGVMPNVHPHVRSVSAGEP